MHLLNVATVLLVICQVSIEFSVAAFINPAASRLDLEPQRQLLSRMAFVLGRVMPVWYPVSAVLLGIQTWLNWHAAGRGVLLAADAIWLLASLASILFLVPMNTQVAEGHPDWQRIHRTWDRRHRVRTAALAVAAVLLTYVVVR